MSIQVQHRRDSRTNIEAGTPAAGELVWDTTLKAIRMGDGATLGGILNKQWGKSYTVSPAQITANQNDYSPTDLAIAETLFINSDAARNITGIALGATNRTLALVNNGSFNITLVDASVLSTAANRFSFGADYILRPKQTALLIWSTATSRWLLLADGFRPTTDLPENVNRSGVISPTQLAANTDDWAPTSLATASVIRATTDASRNLTGLTGGVAGREIEIHNVGSFPLVLKNNVTSTAANRFLFGADITLTTDQCIKLWYDSTTARWRQVGNTAGGAVADGAVTAAKIAASAIAHGPIVNGYLEWTVAASALTVALKTALGTDPSLSDPVYVWVRSATAAPASGTPTYALLTITAALSVVVSSGSSLGTVNATAFKLWATLFNDAGTPRLAVINCLAISVPTYTLYPLAAWEIASSTAEGGAGAADSAQVFYTGTAVTSKGYAVLGYATWETGLAAAGTWSAGPTRAQMFGPDVRLPGARINKQRSQANALSTGTTITPNDDTIPQNTEGDQYLSVGITPQSAAHLLDIKWSVMAGPSVAAWVTAALHQDSVANALAAQASYQSQAGGALIQAGGHNMLAAVSVATTFKMRLGMACRHPDLQRRRRGPLLRRRRDELGGSRGDRDMIRCIYHRVAPQFPATDQHPDAVRYGPLTIDGAVYFVDAIGGRPSDAEIRAVLAPPPEPTPLEKLAAVGLTRDELLAIIKG
jgi:hypothetical protein